MATYEIIAWRDIPALVEARDAGGTATRQLSDRWQALIDSVAMQVGLADSDAYLEQWSRSAPEERSGSASEVADRVAEEIEELFMDHAARAFRRP